MPGPTLIQQPSGLGGVASVQPIADPTNQALRTSWRPLEYLHGSTLLGHYRAVSVSGAVNTTTGGTILAHLCWLDTLDRRVVLTRLAASVAVTAAVTTATPVDLGFKVFRGATAVGSGSGSTTLAATVAKSGVMKNTMQKSLLLTNGEIRTIGTTTALTLPTGGTIDTNYMGFTTYSLIQASNTAGTAVKLWPGNSAPPQDLYNTNLYHHPLELSSGEGVAVYPITANGTDGAYQYTFIWEWAEVAPQTL